MNYYEHFMLVSAATHARYIPRPPHPPSFEHSNNIQSIYIETSVRNKCRPRVEVG
jgi:hypothetical protein